MEDWYKQQDFFDDLKLVKLVEWSQQDLSEIITVTTYNNYKDSRVIKFNSTTINLSNVKTKSTTHPKLQELDSKVLIDCVNNFMIGTKTNYSLPFFVCDKYSSIKSTQEIFKRSFKQRRTEDSKYIYKKNA